MRWIGLGISVFVFAVLSVVAASTVECFWYAALQIRDVQGYVFLKDHRLSYTELNVVIIARELPQFDPAIPM